MSAQRQEDEIDQTIERELIRRIGEAEAAHRPAEVTLAGRRYHLVPVDSAVEVRTSDGSRVVDGVLMPAENLGTTDDPFKGYDPARVRATLEKIRASGGILKGLDIEAFMEEIMESRIQDTPGHRWP